MKFYKTHLEREKTEDVMMNKKYLTYKLKKYKRMVMTP
jgi:hypothetical protein